EDEGYNVEWSQELKVYESFDEYLRAWVLIHALHRKLGFPGDAPGMIFNMSVGYNLDGILQPNVQWYLDAMTDASAYKQRYVDVVAAHYPEVAGIEIPDRISDTITLSTMHGCPPDEIERISAYLLGGRALHTSVKCNPTLLGADRVRSIVNDELGFGDVPVPDEAFGHDLRYVDAVPMFHNLRRLAREKELTFGVKLTNTLEVENWRDVFPADDMMYLSGRPLHAVTSNLALAISEEFRGDLLISFAGGADCFNVPDLLRSGVATITVCSDLLKSGGYMRMLQYFETLNAAMDEVGAHDLTDYVAKSGVARDGFAEFAPMLRYAALTDSGLALDADDCVSLAEELAGEADGLVVDTIESWAVARGFTDDRPASLAALAVKVLGRVNLRDYAAAVRSEWRLRKDSFRTDRSKTDRELLLFDCIEPPCVDECPVNQKVPQYMAAVRDGDFQRAVALAREDNPLPGILGRVCDHLCENTCIRTHYDEPLAIRDIKRFIMAQEETPLVLGAAPPAGARVAIIGAGPAGISAARQLAYAGIGVTIFEAHPYAGGMVGGAIPSYRLPQHEIDKDMAVLAELGVEIRYGMVAGVDFTLEKLRGDGYDFVFVAVGAQLAKRLNLEGEDSDGIMDALRFLRSVREGDPEPLGQRVGVIGAGDTAMDCVRSAYRLGADVSLVYRRTIDQMPADREEIHGAIEEGIEIVELASPAALHIEDGALAGLVCTRMEYRGDRDSSGRKIPHPVPDGEFEIPLDTLILAISQHSVLDFFGDETPELTDRGYLDVNPETLESSLPGLYAGGDVAADGPSSIVKASADGKAVAESIIARVGNSAPEATANGDGEDEFDLFDLLERRAHRDWRVPISFTPLDDRMNFNEVSLTYTREEAMAEASRCLDCHHICSLCVGVCPNLALMTYEAEPLLTRLQTITIGTGAVEIEPGGLFAASQRHQIAVLTDFCNECGNCVTFCPTAGEPYRDKPRLYLDRDDFEAQKDNAFMLFSQGETAALEARWDGETHRLDLDGDLSYSAPAITVRLDPSDLSVLDAAPGSGATPGQVVALDRAASMFVLMRGLLESMPQLPPAVPRGAAAAATSIGHPGYED
ncbi:MAG: FAD-dependent oxidoreductase, partial [Acidimicrobiia bacterium]